jgi:Ca2+-binding EF-hand superfamily protein
MSAISALAASGGPAMMSGASTRAPASQKMSNLFDQMDTSGSGAISQSQFNQAFQTLNPPGDFKAQGADAIWSQLDPAGSGSVDKQSFVTGMTGMMKQMRGQQTNTGTQNFAASPTPTQTISAGNATLANAIAGSRINTLA